MAQHNRDIPGAIEFYNAGITVEPMGAICLSDLAWLLATTKNEQLRDGKNPQMRAMAKKIIASQKKEIAEFDRFLAKQDPQHHTMKK